MKKKSDYVEDLEKHKEDKIQEILNQEEKNGYFYGLNNKKNSLKNSLNYQTSHKHLLKLQEKHINKYYQELNIPEDKFSQYYMQNSYSNINAK